MQEHPVIDAPDAQQIWELSQSAPQVSRRLVAGSGNQAGLSLSGQGQKFSQMAVEIMNSWSSNQEDIDHFQEIGGLFDYLNQTLTCLWQEGGDRENPRVEVLQNLTYCRRGVKRSRKSKKD